jgi:alpha-D-xyloside xylohydrolase
MVYDFPEHPEAQVADLQYLLGPDLLVAPLYRPGGRRLVWFPPGEWLHYQGGPTVPGPGFQEVALPLEHAPLWVRGGSAILLADPGRRIDDGRYARLTLALVLAQSGTLRPTVIDLPSLGGLTITVEPATSGAVSVSAPSGLPPLEVVIVGKSTDVPVVYLNGSPVVGTRRAGLAVSA